jgi:cobalt/nickel transport system permease protein
VTHIPVDRYADGHSYLHRLDPRVKVVTTLALIAGMVMTPEHAWPAYPLLWALLGSLAALGRLGVVRIGRMGAVALPFALAALTLLFTTPGQPLLMILGVPLTDAGLARFAAIVIKSWLAAQAALLLVMTTHLTDLLWALGSLHVPEILLAIIGLAYRYLFTLQEEAQRLLRARAARSGADPQRRFGGRLLWRARVAGGMVGSLFLRSYEQSERVYTAMLARGYTGQIKRLNPPPLSWQSIGQGVLPILIMMVIQGLAAAWWSRSS